MLGIWRGLISAFPGGYSDLMGGDAGGHPSAEADVQSCLTSPRVGILLKVRSQPCCSSGLVLCVFYL